VPNFGFALRSLISQAIEQSLPHLRADFAPLGQFNFEVGYDDGLCVATMQFKDSGVPVVGSITAEKFADLKRAIGTARTHAELTAIPELQPSFGWDRFVMVLDLQNGAVDWEVAQTRTVEWLNDMPLSRALKHNLDRVKEPYPHRPSILSLRFKKRCGFSNARRQSFKERHSRLSERGHGMRGWNKHSTASVFDGRDIGALTDRELGAGRCDQALGGGSSLATSLTNASSNASS
jgi:hypothetical protein